jgi:hypothetical protein
VIISTRIIRLHAAAMRSIPCSDCETPDECLAEGECAIEEGDEE